MDRREALTIRLPSELIAKVRRVKAARESLNDLVVAAVEREVRRREGFAAVSEVRRIREEVANYAGLHPDSTPLIRNLREGIGRRE